MARVCTECGKPLPGNDPRRKTCGSACRAKRSRRIKRARKTKDGPLTFTDDERAITQAVRSEIPEVGHQVMEEELRPIVREAITDETIAAIGKLVALTPTVVEKLSVDVESEDAAIRQKAYTLIAKYTFGHPAIIKTDEEVGGKQMVVNFNIPRPGDDQDSEQPSVEASSQEIRQCDKCGEDKPITEFVAGSYRCSTCYASQQSQANEILESTGLKS